MPLWSCWVNALRWKVGIAAVQDDTYRWPLYDALLVSESALWAASTYWLQNGHTRMQPLRVHQMAHMKDHPATLCGRFSSLNEYSSGDCAPSACNIHDVGPTYTVNASGINYTYLKRLRSVKQHGSARPPATVLHRLTALHSQRTAMLWVDAESCSRPAACVFHSLNAPAVGHAHFFTPVNHIRDAWNRPLACTLAILRCCTAANSRAFWGWGVLLSSL